MSGARLGGTRDPLGDRKRPDVRENVDPHRHRGEFKHGRDFVQNQRSSKVQVRERVQGGRRAFVHLRGKRKVERRSAAMRL